MFIEVKNAVKQYGKGDAAVHALDGAIFSMEKGEIGVILGASGSGKSTLMNMLGGIDTLDSGTIIVDGVEISGYRKKQLVEYRREKIGYPSELSGGQQQRVAIARAIAKNPALLLCDELTGALDSKSAREVLSFVEKVNQMYHTTVLIITHNETIQGFADVIIHVRDGKVTKQEKNPHKIPVSELEL